MFDKPHNWIFYNCIDFAIPHPSPSPKQKPVSHEPSEPGKVNSGLSKQNIALRFPNELSTLNTDSFVELSKLNVNFMYDYWQETTVHDIKDEGGGRFCTWKAATARGSAEGSPNPTSSLAILNTKQILIGRLINRSSFLK